MSTLKLYLKKSLLVQASKGVQDGYQQEDGPGQAVEGCLLHADIIPPCGRGERGRFVKGHGGQTPWSRMSLSFEQIIAADNTLTDHLN